MQPLKRVEHYRKYTKIVLDGSECLLVVCPYTKTSASGVPEGRLGQDPQCRWTCHTCPGAALDANGADLALFRGCPGP